MKKNLFLKIFLLLAVVELAVPVWFAAQSPGTAQDAVAVNTAVHSVLEDWDRPGTHVNQTNSDYVVLDRAGEVRFRTREGLSETIHEAVVHRDTILGLTKDGNAVGTLIFYNDSADALQAKKKAAVAVLASVIVLQLLTAVWYTLWLERVVIRPFQKLRQFAVRVAGGNLDIPLTMDRHNLFGAFTESFDLMRTELKNARIAEAKANESKKELVAKLSHDIRTPVASIRAVAEVGAARAADRKTGENYIQILHKADQISGLVNNLFTATLEELSQLPVTTAEFDSRELTELLSGADYLHCAEIPAVPDCLLCADRLRLQQVFDNIFANAYKYAGITGQKTEMGESGKNGRIEVIVCRRGAYLSVSIEDYGGGVKEEELPFLKEKFRRGSNQTGVEGAGLGLYISDYFMREMKGELAAANGSHGLVVTVSIPLSGGSGGTI